MSADRNWFKNELFEETHTKQSKKITIFAMLCLLLLGFYGTNVNALLAGCALSLLIKEFVSPTSIALMIGGFIMRVLFDVIMSSFAV